MAKRVSKPGPKLRFMKDQEFEDEAALLLAEYGNRHGQVTAPPIPIDEIVELYLKLHLTFDDMQELFGVSDVHGVRGPAGLRLELAHRGRAGITARAYRDGDSRGRAALVCCPAHVRDWLVIMGIETAPPGWWELWRDMWAGFCCGGRRYAPDLDRTGVVG